MFDDLKRVSSRLRRIRFHYSEWEALEEAMQIATSLADTDGLVPAGWDHNVESE